jgi:hypothetical protein
MPQLKSIVNYNDSGRDDLNEKRKGYTKRSS